MTTPPPPPIPPTPGGGPPPVTTVIIAIIIILFFAPLAGEYDPALEELRQELTSMGAEIMRATSPERIQRIQELLQRMRGEPPPGSGE